MKVVLLGRLASVNRKLGNSVANVVGSSRAARRQLWTGTASLLFLISSAAHPGEEGLASEYLFSQSSELDPFAVQLLGASEAQLDAFERARELQLMEIAPVHLPVEPPGDCNHYGWPIATRVGSTLVVMHRRIPGHNPRGAGGPHALMTYGLVMRSDDHGRTWPAPYDLRECMAAEDRKRNGRVPLSHRFKFEKGNLSPRGYKIHLHAIGTTHDGGVIAINNHGVFRSDDAGRSWQHFSDAFRDDVFPHDIVNLGPRVIDHPTLGLTVFGNWFGTVEGPKFSNALVILTSQDGGRTWNVEEHDVGFPQYEPAALWDGDRFLMVTRDQADGGLHRQISWRPRESPVIQTTNLRDPRYVDTVDFALNPVTGRFELVRSERYHMELVLWSMDPADWPRGQWRRECRLLKQQGTFYREADGFHPAAAVIDKQRGVQHIFIYSGHPNGPAGVFRITRTLETDRLAEFLNEGPSKVDKEAEP